MSINDTLKAISDPIRRNILELLKNGKMSAGDIAEKFDLTNATVSYHLSQLKKAGLVNEEKQKNFIYYEINLSVFEDILMWIQQLGG
ncbi:autorepressor SdpR family transcription factor [Anaerorhabdus sp.]|jgi:ArsR family transcriptional regulator, arsenate/arsenite/antimonite-responsive transcriptional repressor|uniref:autorepressor SdpR family transcription factor n=1 Tax=Anaerorhabdus sp. TaxID=1872524 RepID=UPI002FC731C9